MAMYYFHTRQADGVEVTDVVGVEFESAAKAREEANHALAEMLQDLKPDDGVTVVEIRVHNEHGATIARRSARFEVEDFEAA